MSINNSEELKIFYFKILSFSPKNSIQYKPLKWPRRQGQATLLIDKRDSPSFSEVLVSFSFSEDLPSVFLPIISIIY